MTSLSVDQLHDEQQEIFTEIQSIRSKMTQLNSKSIRLRSNTNSPLSRLSIEFDLTILFRGWKDELQIANQQF